MDTTLPVLIALLLATKAIEGKSPAHRMVRRHARTLCGLSGRECHDLRPDPGKHQGLHRAYPKPYHAF